MNRQQFEYHPTIGYRFIPGLKARVEHEGGGYLLRVNGSGFRCNHEFTREKPPGKFRVLLFGDSYTAGDGVSNKHRYSDILEDMLPEIEVFNLALSGTGTDQQFLIYQEFAKEIDHDLVVISVLVENIRRVAARFRPFLNETGEEHIVAKPYYELGEDGELALHHVPCPREPIQPADLGPDDAEFLDTGGENEWLRSMVNRMGPKAKEWVQRVSRHQPLPEYADANGRGWRLMKAILSKWVEESTSPVLICPIPLYQYIEGTSSAADYTARFKELEDETDATIHDPLPDFESHSAEERRAFRFETDCHLTPPAHRVLAESLAGPIKRYVAEKEH